MRFVLALVCILLFVGEVSARGRSSRSYSTTVYRSTSYGSNPQAVASNKASAAAARGIRGHVGGGFGGGRAEGVGFSTRSAADALNNCCFTGQRRVAGSSVVRGKDGWYAVKIYW